MPDLTALLTAAGVANGPVTVTRSGSETAVIVPVSGTNPVRVLTPYLDLILTATGALRVTGTGASDGNVTVTLTDLPLVSEPARVGDTRSVTVGGSSGWHGLVGHHAVVGAVAQAVALPAAPAELGGLNPLAMVVPATVPTVEQDTAPRSAVARYLPHLSRLRDPDVFRSVMKSAGVSRSSTAPVAGGEHEVTKVTATALPTLRRAYVAPRGLCVEFAAAPVGVSLEDWEKGKGHLAAALGTDPATATVTVTTEGTVSFCTGDRDPLSSVSLPSSITEVPTDPDRIMIGAREDGSPAWLQLRDSSSLLITGLSGSGKTDSLLSIIRPVIASRPTELIVVSGKGSDDMASIGEGAATYIVGSSVEDRERLVAALNDIIDRRSRESRAWSSSNYWAVASEQRAPLVVVVLDEVHRLLSGTAASAEGKAAKVLSALLHELITAGRSLGIWTVLTTQRPSSKVLDTDLRESITAFIALRQTTSTAKMSLPEGYPWIDDADLDPSRLPVHVQGRAVVTAIPTSDGVPLARVQLLHLPAERTEAAA